MTSTDEVKKKIVLLGDAAVGKTSLIRKFVVDKFDDNYLTTVGFKITKRDLQIKRGRDISFLKLQIWDILGQKGYIEMHQSSLPGTAGVFLVADITRKETLKSIEKYWIPTLFNIIGKVPFLILANKADLEEKAEITEKELKMFAADYEAPFYLTSAKSGKNVSRAFHHLGKRILKLKGSVIPRPEGPKPLEYEKTAVVELLDRIIDDFCGEFGRYNDAMPILRRQFELSNLDINHPEAEAIIMVIKRLALIEKGFMDRNIVETNLNKRLKWLKEIGLY
jgi:small GTP-binding protein